MTSRPAIRRLGPGLLRVFTERPATPAWISFAGVLAITLAIAAADYVTNVSVSFLVAFIIPVSLAVGWLGLRSAVMFSILGGALHLACNKLNTPDRPLPYYTWWNTTEAVACLLLLAWLLHHLLNLRRQLQGRVDEQSGELLESLSERQRLEGELLRISARERSAFGRELHDDVGQQLFATALSARVLSETLTRNADPQAAAAAAIAGRIEDCIGRTRKLARGLLLAGISADSLGAELAELAAASENLGVTCRVREDGARIDAPDAVCAELFRIAQEAVNNALRHARPGTIDIALAADEEALCLIVEDDGCGLPAEPSAGGGMGLRIMEHRARFIGAHLSLVSQPGTGTRVVCRLPRGLGTPS
jgi:signal transduction histidine kinase